jgi:capsid protein
MFIPQVCEGVWDWAMEVGQAAGIIGQPIAAKWTAPPMPLIEPDKEGLAYKRLVRSGTMSLYEAIRERGNDPVAHLEEIAAGNAELDRLGIWLDSDPRRTSDAGLTQERAGGGGGAEKAAEDKGALEGAGD